MRLEIPLYFVLYAYRLAVILSELEYGVAHVTIQK